jgi:hypothetical protein
VYEDEGDDAMEDDERAKERRMLEEAAKKVPALNIPSGLSFAKDVSCSPLPCFVDCRNISRRVLLCQVLMISRTS